MEEEWLNWSVEKLTERFGELDKLSRSLEYHQPTHGEFGRYAQDLCFLMVVQEKDFAWPDAGPFLLPMLLARWQASESVALGDSRSLTPSPLGVSHEGVGSLLRAHLHSSL